MMKQSLTEDELKSIRSTVALMWPFGSIGTAIRVEDSLRRYALEQKQRVFDEAEIAMKALPDSDWACKL